MSRRPPRGDGGESPNSRRPRKKSGLPGPQTSLGRHSATPRRSSWKVHDPARQRAAEQAHGGNSGRSRPVLATHRHAVWGRPPGRPPLGLPVLWVGPDNRAPYPFCTAPWLGVDHDGQYPNLGDLRATVTAARPTTASVRRPLSRRTGPGMSSSRDSTVGGGAGTSPGLFQHLAAGELALWAAYPRSSTAGVCSC